MNDTVTFSSATRQCTQINMPIAWAKCPRISNIIADKFIAFKTPLDQRFETFVSKADRWTCAMLVNKTKNLGLVIDLTNTTQYYIGTTEFQEKNIIYEKLACTIDDHQLPTDEMVNQFIEICDRFISVHPNEIIGVHCVYGFNQTGYLICTYLSQKLNYSIHNAIATFAQARPPGIKKQDFINVLLRKFRSNDLTTEISKPVFAIQHDDIVPICSPILLDYFHLKYQQLSNSKSSFPTCKPTLLTEKNYQTIFLSSYQFTPITAGIRYLMLIENENEVYLLDQNKHIFQVNHLCFPHSSNTLLDGEFLVKSTNGSQTYRYLIFDILIYKNENVSEQKFSERLKIIDDDIIKTRSDPSIQSQSPFSIERKKFYELSQIFQFFDHNGFIFQSVSNAYQSTSTFKWRKYLTHNFQLKTSSRANQVDLYLSNSNTVYATMSYSQLFDQYFNRIIECSYVNQQWQFNRFRPDRKLADQNNGHDNQLLTSDAFRFFLEEKLAFDNL